MKLKIGGKIREKSEKSPRWENFPDEGKIDPQTERKKASRSSVWDDLRETSNLFVHFAFLLLLVVRVN